MQNRPWDIWWDFHWNDNEGCISGIVIETNLPGHNGFLHKYSIYDIVDENGHVDLWIENEFQQIRDDLKSGRVSINKVDSKYFNKFKRKVKCQ